MKKFFKKTLNLVNKFIKAFNFAFFIISILIWFWLTGTAVATQAFEWSLLWTAFNQLYAQFSFKVGCIFLIIFNGLQTVRSWIFEYYEWSEYAEHMGTLKKLVSKKKA